MPVQRGRDTNGAYYSWGDAGHRYYYEEGNAGAREAAKQLAQQQGAAIKASEARRNKKAARASKCACDR